MSEERLQVGLTAEEVDALVGLVDKQLEEAQFLIQLMNKLKAAKAGVTARPTRETEGRRA